MEAACMGMARSRSQRQEIPELEVEGEVGVGVGVGVIKKGDKKNSSLLLRRLFLRGIHACHWSKALWTRGLRLLLSVGAMDAGEVMSLITVMEKHVHVRTDVVEILLRQLDAEEDEEDGK